METIKTLSKYELYPTEEPIGYLVGFTIECNGRSFFRQTIVSIEIALNKSEEQIISYAYNELKEDIEEQIEILSKKSLLIGKIITL